MIQRIELVNFMSHEHSVIDLSEGLTVLVGPNNCGKSAIVAALQVVCYNDNSSYVLRHEARECSVTIETDDGHVVRWSRKKNGSPRYEIDGKPFDRLRGRQPEELHAILQLPRVSAAGRQFDVHFGTQRSPVFLLDEPGSAAADFFASSSDAIRLVEMQSLHKQNVTDQTRERKRLISEETVTNAMLEMLKPLESVMSDLDAIEQQHRDLTVELKRMESLGSMARTLTARTDELTSLSRRIDGFSGLIQPPALAETRVLESLADSMNSCRARLETATITTTALSDLNAPPAIASTRELEQIIDEISRNQTQLACSLAGKQALEILKAPPVLEIIQTLESSLTSILKWQTSLESLQRCYISLSALTRLEIDESRTPELEKQIESLKQVELIVAAREKELIGNDRAFDEVRAQIADWVDANPVCPTCGSAITSEQMIAGQEHQHES